MNSAQTNIACHSETCLGPLAAWPALNWEVIMDYSKAHFLGRLPACSHLLYMSEQQEGQTSRCQMQDVLLQMSRWGGKDQMKRALQVDEVWKKQERTGSACLPMKSGREANVATPECKNKSGCCLIWFHSFHFKRYNLVSGAPDVWKTLASLSTNQCLRLQQELNKAFCVL